MKKCLTLLAIFWVTLSTAQQLEQYIPGDVQAVIQLNGDQFFELMPEEELMAKLLPSSENPGKSDMNLGDYGFDTDSKMYMFYYTVDSIPFYGGLLKIEDLAKAENTMAQNFPPSESKINGFNISRGGEMSLAYNDKVAMLVNASFPKKEYTLDELIAEWEDEIEELGEDEEVDLPEMPTEDDVRIRNIFAEPIHTIEQQEVIVNNFLNTMLKSRKATSLAMNTSFQKAKEKNSSALIWVGNLNNIIGDFMPKDIYGVGLPVPDGSSAFNNGFKSLSANLIFEKDKLKIASQYEMDEVMGKKLEKMYDSKLDRSFLKYFDQDDMIAYMSATVDTRKMLEEYPDLATYLYGGMFSGYKEEIDVVTDVMSVMLDEKAISKMITGDMLMILHDVENREVTYTDYEYDEEYNVTEVEKTKTSPYPTFTVMLGSEERQLMNKIMNIGVKHQLMGVENTYYKLNEELGLPLDGYAVINDDIVFITNSMDRVMNYSLGKKMKDLGKHKKHLRCKTGNFYVDLAKAVDESMDIYPIIEPDLAQYLKKNVKSLHMYSGKIKDNRMNFDMVLNMDKSHGNSLRALIDVYNEVMKSFSREEADNLGYGE